jgi:16S rRNA (cytidine1402-2'-O)-methyltransferase
MPLNLPTDNTKNTHSKGTLFVVATPIGNMDDITLRALKVLNQVDLIAAEDTRHTGKLLKYHNIKRPLMSYHEHNERERTPLLIERMASGASIALVSNAGTPTISDPGYILLQNAVEKDINIIPVPGASAGIAALSISGLPTDSFVFIGFPAKKKAKRLKQLQGLASEKRTLIFYENPGRILAFLEELIEIMGDRNGVLCREMTKLHEEFLRGRLSEFIDSLSHRPGVKGECTLLVSGCEEKKKVSKDVIRAELIDALDSEDGRMSEISKIIAKKYGVSKNWVYDEALKLKAEKKLNTEKTQG